MALVACYSPRGGRGGGDQRRRSRKNEEKEEGKRKTGREKNKMKKQEELYMEGGDAEHGNGEHFLRYLAAAAC